ncbi:MAG: HipA domain-containing protein [Gammaproteobacteria bacterium]|nr:HipA domain-containing protein [Gammaproteobacteria bacterium]
MTLHLVGETLDKTRSHYLAETGKLVQLMRGIYVDAGDDIDQTVLSHAVRIARYLYPNAYLSAASAVLLGPTQDGRLYLTGPRAQRTRIRALEIIQNKAPTRPSLASAIIADSLGEFPVSVSAPRLRLLEAFRLRSEHAVSIDTTMRDTIAARLVEEYGDAKAASDAVWALARENDWYREGEGAERFLRRSPAATLIRNEAAFQLTTAWHGIPIGSLSHDGFEWRWEQTREEPLLPPLVRQTVPGKLPAFISSLLPEGWLEQVLKHNRDDRAMLRSGKRYMSNITIAANTDELVVLPADVLLETLADHAKQGLFTGKYAGPGRDAIEQDFAQRLAELYSNADTPRLSGFQIKAPMYLASDGTLSPSIVLPFTHILKPAGVSGFETMPVVEWIGLALARACGMPVPEAALIIMPDDMSPALLVERFDIRSKTDDSRLLAMEDMCSVLDLTAKDKYTGTIERIARAVRALSSDPEKDTRLLLQRALFAWLIADGDMHLKNLALLKTAYAGESKFSEVRLAPVYDTLTTRVFPGLEHDRMALTLNGKDERLKRADFVAVATLASMRTIDANAAMDELLQRLNIAIDTIEVPAPCRQSPAAQIMITKTLEICRQRIMSFK